ncbi:hypothetical protein RHSIM_Rhsim11G0124800 [Rhododendron simsii]|uniref:Uncharacterized protein n=1 Tax=Rhododendron simsii TaxID=118357 RepID=A0A834GD03_RHOSS|nr:hypothetical protein RHSIM_Rhsim11G0124800 [Rhododendron simsii]
MLMSEELCLAHTPNPASTVLLAQHHNVSMASSSSTPSSSVNHSITPPLPQPSTQQGGFQYPVQFGIQAPQFGPPPMAGFPHGFGQNNYGGYRNNRNSNRPKGMSFSRNPFPMDFPFPPGSCQICGKFNHQALTCYHRQNLGYRPPVFHQFGPQHGQGNSFFRPPAQALMIGGNSINAYGTGSSYPPQNYNGYSQQNYPGLGYASSFYQGYTPAPSLSLGSPGVSTSHSGFHSGFSVCLVHEGYPGQHRAKVAELSTFGRLTSLEENEAATKKFEQAATKRSYKPACQVFLLKSYH